MKKFYLFSMTMMIVIGMYAQTITLTFTGRDANGLHCQLNQVTVTNLSHDWQETLCWPDTTLILSKDNGVDDNEALSCFKLSQNTPNPFVGITEVSLDVIDDEDIYIEVLDMSGKVVLSKNIIKVQAGTYVFRVQLSTPQTYVLTARQGRNSASIKMVNNGMGSENSIALLEHVAGKQAEKPSKDTKGNVTHPWSYGDNLVILGTSTICMTDYSKSVSLSLMYDETVTFDFQGHFALPSGLATEVVNVTTNIATLRSTVSGSCGVSSRGFCYGTSPNPTLNGLHTSNGSGTGNFTSNIGDLTPSTTYYVRAYATNTAGIRYGTAQSITTKALPTVITLAVSDITNTTAKTGCNVTSEGGVPVPASGVCWNTSTNPTVSDNMVNVGAGGGGPVTCFITGLTPGTTYYVRAYATNIYGTAYGNELNFTTPMDSMPCIGTSTITDYDNNIYNTIMLGNQCWMKENLRTTHYSNGASIPLGRCFSNTAAYRFFPNNDASNVNTYGYLYNWAAVMHGATSSSANPSGVQGICPIGWHVPSDAEWTQLTNHVSGQTQYQCDYNSAYIAKALASTTGWRSYSQTCAAGNNPSANNATGFSAFPAGKIGNYTHFLGESANFWSSTKDPGINSRYFGISGGYAGAGVGSDEMQYGLSVRCVRDSNSGSTGSVTLPTVTTTTVNDIVVATATCGGNVTSDGGAAITARGVCWSTTHNPTVSNSYTVDSTGTGAFTSSIIDLASGTTYYVRAYASNSQGTAYGNEVSFTSDVYGPPCSGTPTVTDYDNNVYNTVQIGNQCWMKENLRTTHYANGASIPLGVLSSTMPYRYCPYNDSSIVDIYGYMYNWAAVMHGAISSSANPSGVQGICPTGWHVPSDAEWTQLTNYVSGQTQYQCGNNSTYIAKALAATTGWNSYSSTGAYASCYVGYNPSANNATGFSVIPLGEYGSNFPFGTSAYFWSSSAYEYDDDDAYCRYLLYGDNKVNRNQRWKTNVFSVRCVRDSNSGSTGSVTLPTVTTTTVNNIVVATATCGGNVTSDGGAAVTARGVCWSTTHNPTVSDNYTADGTGTGVFTSSIIDLASGTTYYVRAYASNSQGTAYGNEVSFTSNVYGPPCSGTLTVTDYDNNVYNTVQIGNQCWMKENLRTTHYANGASISSGDLSAPMPYSYCPSCPRNDSSIVGIYGYLYNWAAVMHGASSSSANPSGVQGICPTGWHVPSDAEWTQLTNYVSGQTQYRCGNNSTYIAKALAATTGWNSYSSTSSSASCYVGYNPSANNATGFSAIAAMNEGGGASFWSSTANDANHAFYRRLSYNDNKVDSNFLNKSLGFSVRCLRD